jgi:hypothetical protein
MKPEVDLLPRSMDYSMYIAFSGLRKAHNGATPSLQAASHRRSNYANETRTLEGLVPANAADSLAISAVEGVALVGQDTQVFT